jgi:hypothetical protein
MDHDWPLLYVGITAIVRDKTKVQQITCRPRAEGRHSPARLPTVEQLAPDVEHVKPLWQVEIQLQE